MKINKLTVVCLSAVLTVGAATFAFAAPAPQDTTKTTKTKKSKKTTDTTSTKATTATTAPPAAAATKTTAKTTKSETTKNATPEQIAAAKAAGQVWVNTSTKVYHDASSQFYGSTKAGKFMSEKDAIAAGNHKAKNEK